VSAKKEHRPRFLLSSMHPPTFRTVVFADLRGSTALYGSLGNAQAAAVVTSTVSLLAKVIDSNGGTLVKTLGDGLMA
jgi:class 3 adenylate cyclase